MPSYTIDYQAWNEYQHHVGESFFSLLIVPCNDDKQQLIRNKVENSLQENIFYVKNHHGFSQMMLHSMKSFGSLEIKMKCDVLVSKINSFGYSSLPWDEEISLLSSTEFTIDHYAFLQNRHYTTVHRHQYPESWNKKHGELAAEFLLRLNENIHKEFTYDPESTSVHQIADLTLQMKRGVCQDYAHVFVGISRTNGIPCRYVSGYLNQGHGFTGALQMHAWAEALLPGTGWIGYDPTNNLLRDANYVKVCHGADYDDCSPIKGILKTEGSNETRYEIKVVQQ